MREIIALDIEKNIGMTEVKLLGQGIETPMMRWITTEGGTPIAKLIEIIAEKSVEDPVLIGELQVCKRL